jgi:predicted aspartyl protease
LILARADRDPDRDPQPILGSIDAAGAFQVMHARASMRAFRRSDPSRSRRDGTRFIAVMAICIAMISRLISDFVGASSAHAAAPHGSRIVPARIVPPRATRVDAGSFPPGSEIIDFENVEGVLLVQAQLRGPNRDTTVTLALDTGAGFLALDRPLARALGIGDDSRSGTLEYAEQPLARLKLGSLEIDQVSPVLTLDAKMIREVTDRPVGGLIGEHVFTDRGLWIDYQAARAAIIPIPHEAPVVSPIEPSQPRPSSRGHGTESASDSRRDARLAASRASFSRVFSDRATAVPFELAGDGKVLVRARVSNPSPPRYSSWLTLIVDTGATKCVLFADALRDHVSGAREWASLRGLTAPTLFGTSEARVVRIPSTELEIAGAPAAAARASRPTTARVAVSEMDAVVMQSDLEDLLSRAVGRRVDGLLGYSFLKRFRIAFDYPRRILWIDPLPEGWDDRPYEYSHVGLQVERRGEAISVVGIAEPSPAAESGIQKGDEVVSVDGKRISEFDVVKLSRYLEGKPGTGVKLWMRRGGTERSYSLTRRRLF